DQRAQDCWSEECGGADEQEAAADVARRSDGDQPREVAVAARVAIPEHPAHAVAQVEDLVAARAPLDRLDGGGDVLEQVAVEVPVPVDVFRQRPALLRAQLSLQLARAAPVAPQLEDVAVGTVDEEALHERRASECVP